MRYVFVGERPSPTAFERGWKWEDGRLAASQLFDALLWCGIDPARQSYANIFGTRPDGPWAIDATAAKTVRKAAKGGAVVVAMGQRVSTALKSLRVDHVAIVHPAARGAIRKKERYRQHVLESLTRNGQQEARNARGGTQDRAAQRHHALPRSVLGPEPGASRPEQGVR